MFSTRTSAASLLVAGALFVLYPATRPWTDESTVDGAIEAMGSAWWVASHLFAMLGFVLVALGTLAVRDAVTDTRGGPIAQAALVTTWAGAGLVLPYYGAEAFGLHALALDATDESRRSDLLLLVETVRYNPVAVTMFGVGLLTLAAGTILTAVAVRRSGIPSRAGGLSFALGFALFLPQFYTPAPVRVAHGVLVGAGCCWLALTLWRSRATT